MNTDMKKQTNTHGGMSAGKVVAIGAGVAALAAASYYFFGPEGQKNRKSIKGWMIKMKGEIVDKMEDAQEVTEAVYHQIVDTVAANYLKGGKAASSEVAAFVNVLKKQWRGISKSTTGAKKKKKATGAVKKVAKKTTTSPKKVAKKK